MVSTRGKGDSKIKLENSVERRRSYSVRRNCILQNGGDFSLNSRTRQSFRNQKQSPGESWCFDDQQLKGYPNKEDNEYHDSSVTSPELPIGRAVQSPKSKSRYGKRRHDMRFRATTIVSPLRTRSFRRNSLNDPRKSTPIIKEIDSNDGEDEGDCEDDRETALNCESTPKSRVSSSTNLRRNRYPAKNNVENEDTYDDSNDHNWMEDSHVDTKTEDESSANDKAMEDGYGKSKRVRKPVVRLMYDNGTNYVRQLRPRRISSSSSSSDSEDEAATKNDKESYRSRSKYSLRQNKTSVRSYAPIDGRRFSFRQNRKDDLINSARKKKRFNKIYRATHNTDLSSTSSSSSSDEMEFEKRKSKSMKKARNQCLPMNFNPEDALTLTHRERQQIGRSLADIDPMYVDKSITFDSVGGLDEHVKSLKEMILFPLMYPEVFNKFNVTPPRGVLFYGCPGTGKTMVARALAAECSQKDKKVAFFMRKGADCLSKWVGESERQLRLLFDQAYQMRPSIIFFDEVDGLAPVRSSRQDQIHSSIVSTLLALMDGLDDRGQVIVIGATNRIDAIDPALRRPGRFDREFYFPLPSLEARKQILEIHTQKWSPNPEDTLLQYLAEETVGYCGADLKALCGEAALNALRSRYPQIYKSDKKLLLDVDTVQINRSHFNQSLGKLVPAGQRASVSACRKLDRIIEPLLQPWLKIVLKNLKHSFPHGFNKQLTDRIMGNSKLLLAGSKGQGQSSHLAPAVLHALEGIPTYKLDFPTMCSSVTKSPEEACVHAFQEARRNAPSILYLPLIDHWWDMALDSLKTAFVCLIKQLDPTLPLLVLSTSETAHDTLPSDLKEMFNSYRSEVITLTYPKEVLRKAFFHPIFYVDMYKEPEDPPVSEEDFEELPLAPTPLPRQLNEHELKKVERKEESTLRELRIFLREICSKLAKNRMFYFFAKPVDLEEVPDYRDVISCPMDLETMMIKIDNHYYVCAEDFLNDVDLICSNALEYNPATNSEDKLIRHRACALRDTAYAYIKAEMDTDFEDNCQNIRKARQDRSQSNKNPTTSKRESPAKAKETAVGAGAPNRSAKKRRRSTWARGLIKTPSLADKRRKVLESVNGHNEKEEKTEENTSNDVKENSVPVSEQNGAVITRKRLSSLSLDGASSPPDGRIATAEAAISVEDEVNVSGQKHTVKVIIDKRQLDSTYSKCVSVTEKCSVDDLYYLYTLIQRLIQEHIFVPNKTNLLNTVKEEVEKFAKSAVH